MVTGPPPPSILMSEELSGLIGNYVTSPARLRAARVHQLGHDVYTGRLMGLYKNSTLNVPIIVQEREASLIPSRKPSLLMLIYFLSDILI